MIDSTDSATALARQAGGNFESPSAASQPGTPSRPAMIHQFFATLGREELRRLLQRPRRLRPHQRPQGDEARRARDVLPRRAADLARDRPAIFLYNLTTLAGMSASLGGVELAPNGQLLIQNAWFK